MEYLRNRIQDQQILKDAQAQNGPYCQAFQGEITNLTSELREWERNIGEINQLEDEIATANELIEAAKWKKLHAADNWFRLTIVCFLIGVSLLALRFRWSLKLIPLWLILVLLALAGGAWLMAMMPRTSARNKVATEKRRLAQLRKEQDKLIPEKHPSTKPFPRFSHEVIVRNK